MAEFEQVLTTLQRLLGKLVSTVEQHKLTPQEVWSIIRRKVGKASCIANARFQSADQAVLAISTLQGFLWRGDGAAVE